MSYTKYDSNNPTAVRLGGVRFSYVNVFAPRTGTDGKGNYSVCVIIPKTNTEALKAFKAAQDAALKKGIQDKWGGKAPSGLKYPLRDGDIDRPDDEAFQNSYFFNCKMSAEKGGKPGVAVKIDGIVSEALDADDFYSGCYGVVSCNLYPYNSNGNRGIGVGLQNVCKTEDGEKLSGSVASIESDFSDLND